MHPLKHQRDFDIFKSRGIKLVSKFFVLVYLDKSCLTDNFLDNHLPYAIKVTKKLGSAVMRNKIKRRIKHILLCAAKTYIKTNQLAYLIIARNNRVASQNFIVLQKDFDYIFKKSRSEDDLNYKRIDIHPVLKDEDS